MTAVVAPTANLVQGDVVVDTWARVADAADLAGYVGLEDRAHLLTEGRMFAWLIEMDTKYARGEAINAPYSDAGLATVRFELPDDHWLYLAAEAYNGTVTDTHFHVHLPSVGTWRLGVHTGRYDHLVVLERTDQA